MVSINLAYEVSESVNHFFHSPRCKSSYQNCPQVKIEPTNVEIVTLMTPSTRLRALQGMIDVPVMRITVLCSVIDPWN